MEDNNNNPQDSKLRNRKIFTMKEWCKRNGYDGVTKECLLSASQQENSKLKEMAKEHLKTGIVNKIRGK